MIINGRGYICKSCKRELMNDDVTYYASKDNQIPVITTNCCKSKVVKPSLLDNVWKRLCRK